MAINEESKQAPAGSGDIRNKSKPLCEYCGHLLNAHWWNEETNREVCADQPGCKCDGNPPRKIQTTEIETDPVARAGERCVNLLAVLDTKYTFTTEECDEVLEAIKQLEKANTAELAAKDAEIERLKGLLDKNCKHCGKPIPDKRYCTVNCSLAALVTANDGEGGE